jgi:hypothetical protein
MPHIYGLKIQFTKEMDKANFAGHSLVELSA